VTVLLLHNGSEHKRLLLSYMWTKFGEDSPPNGPGNSHQSGMVDHFRVPA